MLKQFLDCYKKEEREKHLDAHGESADLKKTQGRWMIEATADSYGVRFLGEMPENIFQSIRDYHNNPYVQNAFWDINQNIYSFISEKDVAQESELREIIQSLINELTQQYEKMRQLKSGHTCSGLYAGWYCCDLAYRKAYAEIVIDQIIDEFRAPKGTYRIHRGEKPRKDIAQGRLSNLCLSFSDGLFGGIVGDYQTGMAFAHFIKNKHAICIDLSKIDLLLNRLPLFPPPVISLGAALGNGEGHHVRTKKIEKAEDCGHCTEDFQRAEVVTKENNPQYFVEKESEIWDFWRRLRLTGTKEYEVPSDAQEAPQLFDIKTYELK